MIKMIFILSILVIIWGCATGTTYYATSGSTNSAGWHHPTATQQQMMNDMWQCRYQASQMGRGIVQQIWYEGECMTMKGYIWR